MRANQRDRNLVALSERPLWDESGVLEPHAHQQRGCTVSGSGDRTKKNPQPEMVAEFLMR